MYVVSLHICLLVSEKNLVGGSYVGRINVFDGVFIKFDVQYPSDCDGHLNIWETPLDTWWITKHRRSVWSGFDSPTIALFMTMDRYYILRICLCIPSYYIDTYCLNLFRNLNVAVSNLQWQERYSHRLPSDINQRTWQTNNLKVSGSSFGVLNQMSWNLYDLHVICSPFGWTRSGMICLSQLSISVEVQ